MKITIIEPAQGEEEELIIKAANLDEQTLRLINSMKNRSRKMNAYLEGKIFFIAPEEIFYFEAVDQKVFAYCKSEVYEVKSKLYELEEELSSWNFIRTGKSVILNLNRIKRLSPAFSGRLEALLQNGEKIIISRQYVALLKERLGL